jgi:hypothetical protein
MKNLDAKDTESPETWTAPEINIFLITEETLGVGIAGPDFGSQES